jgi:hypothetical protein
VPLFKNNDPNLQSIFQAMASKKSERWASRKKISSTFAAPGKLSQKHLSAKSAFKRFPDRGSETREKKYFEIKFGGKFGEKFWRKILAKNFGEKFWQNIF